MGQDSSSSAPIDGVRTSIGGSLATENSTSLHLSSIEATWSETDPDSEEIDLNGFDLEGFTREEALTYNAMAEEGQRLQDSLTPTKVALSMRKPFDTIENTSTSDAVLRQLYQYIGQHPFVEKCRCTFTKSERRQFERNVYDFGRGLGLARSQARDLVVKARWFCGDEGYDSANSAFEKEIDDSVAILAKLPRTNGNRLTVMPVATEEHNGIANGGHETKAYLHAATRPQADATSTEIRLSTHDKSARISSDNGRRPQSKVIDRKFESLKQRSEKEDIHNYELIRRFLHDHTGTHAEHETPQAMIARKDASRARQRRRERRQKAKDQIMSSQNVMEVLNEQLELEEQSEAIEAGKRKRGRDKGSLEGGAAEFLISNDTVSMTAAVEGLSKQCKEVATALDASFNMMVALISDSTLQREVESPTAINPPNEFPRPLIDSADEAKRRPEASVPTTPRGRKSKTRPVSVSPYFSNLAENHLKNTESPYFPKTTAIKVRKIDKVSCIPFPPLDSASFGLVQETLAHDPFRLLIAVIFLNKTRGHVAMPVFYELMERYPTPADLAAADLDDVVEIIQHLGLQNQRAAKCINLAKAWLERPPEKGKRYRLLHYPNRGDGKDIKVGEVIDEGDERVGWEIGQLPGVGAYAIDSWRIFCRDELRGLPTGMPIELNTAARKAELEKEWTRVLPLDKELRAYLRWRWLRNGWEWDPITGERKRAEDGTVVKADKGGVMYEGDDSNIMMGQEEFNALNVVRVEPTNEGEPEDESDVRGLSAP